MTKNITRVVGVFLRQPVPGGAGVFIRRQFRGQQGRAFAESAVVDGQHGKTEFLHAAHPGRRAGHVVSGAVQVQQHRGFAADRLIGLQPEAVQANGLVALPALPGTVVNPHVRHTFGSDHATAPGTVAGLENPRALLFVQR